MKSICSFLRSGTLHITPPWIGLHASSLLSSPPSPPTSLQAQQVRMTPSKSHPTRCRPRPARPCCWKRSRAQTINRYPPDLTAAPLREALGTQLRRGWTRCCVGTGSRRFSSVPAGTQVVALLRVYPIAVPTVRADPVSVPLSDGSHDTRRHHARAIADDTVALILCSPNKLTGPALTTGDRLLRR